MSINLSNVSIEYVQSANTIFHFMREFSFLFDALERKALVPRYCEENISYLDLKVEDKRKDKISVLQKCFCDMPLHMLTKSFKVDISVENSNILYDNNENHLNKTHTDFYGKYAIAFSKQWGEQNGLQPIHYINMESSYFKELKSYIEYILNIEDLSDELFNDFLTRLAFIKPLQGEMLRDEDGNKLNYIKNFHDEKEWRYVPSGERLHRNELERVMFGDETNSKKNNINKLLEDTHYNDIWLNFNYQDIKYIIVPNAGDRINLIEYINNKSDFKSDNDDKGGNLELQKSLLISRILVLDEIGGDC